MHRRGNHIGRRVGVPRSATGLVVAALVVAALAAACGSSGGSGSADEETTSTTAVAARTASFGDLPGPVCGPGDFEVDRPQAGKGADKLYIGVANDRDASVAPGLFKVNYDASVAFADWCNERGGIGGLPIEVVDLDAGVFNVEAAMTTACSDVFAMVGGGFAQDQLEFSGKDASDFHRCGMIDLPGFVVSAKKGDSNGQVQPVPNPGTTVADTWLRDLHRIHPDTTEATVVWGELPSLEVVKNKYEAALGDVAGLRGIGSQPYPPVGGADWTPPAPKLIDSGAETAVGGRAVSFPRSFLTAARQQRWTGEVVSETNIYDQQLLAGGDAVEGAVARVVVHPLEEADRWPAVRQYLDMVRRYVPDGTTGPMGMQSLSAWLLFATTAKAGGAAHRGGLRRRVQARERRGDGRPRRGARAGMHPRAGGGGERVDRRRAARPAGPGAGGVRGRQPVRAPDGGEGRPLHPALPPARL